MRSINNCKSWMCVACAVLFIFISGAVIGQKIKVLVITGGHEFDKQPFFEMFDEQHNISYDSTSQPRANALIASKAIDSYDVLVFYDMFGAISPRERQAYINLLNRGKGMIFLHHALASYQGWPQFINLLGGHYHEKPVLVKGDTMRSNYKHDVDMAVIVSDKSHPITMGINDFEIVDERYGNVEVLPSVKPLLDTMDPKSMRPLAWINHVGKSDVVYIQLGHGPTAYANSSYRKLVAQAIVWSAVHHPRK